MRKQKKIMWWIILIGIIATIGYWVYTRPSPAESTYGPFAQCLKEKGVTFYGAFWCPHCQNQKKLFGDAVSLLPYIECSTANGQGQTQICIDQKITGYPTWEFKDKSRLNGEIRLDQLAEKSGCKLPQ